MKFLILFCVIGPMSHAAETTLCTVNKVGTLTHVQHQIEGDCFQNGMLQKNKLPKDLNFVHILSPIGVITKRSVQHLRNVETLMFDNNGISYIQGNVFQNFRRLGAVGIINNHLEGVQEGTFRNMPIRKLELWKNRISGVLPKSFSNLPNLKWLDLSFNNLTQWSPDWFEDVPSLEYLSVGSNKIASLPDNAFNQFSKLQTLSLNANSICTISPTAFHRLYALNTLNIADNRITFFHPDAFKDFYKQRGTIDIENNYLSYLPQKLLDSLKDWQLFYVGENPWRCPCLQKLESWAYDNNISLSYNRKSKNNPICVAPTHTNDCVEELDNEAVLHFLLEGALEYKPCLQQ